MTSLGTQRPSRDALLAAIIGDPRPPLPPVAAVDLGDFWQRFDATAPLHLRLGFGAATVVVGQVVPRLLGHRRGLARLDAGAAGSVVQRAATWPGSRRLVEVAKVVACFGYFSDPAVQAGVRGGR